MSKDMAYSKEYHAANRDLINKKRRERYNSEGRKAYYQRNRLAMLERGKQDRACCPLCGLDFRRVYIPKHIATRHKVKTPP